MNIQLVQHYKNRKGFTLVELMVAMVLGIIVLFAVTQVLNNNRLLTNTEVSLSRIQEAGRLAVNLLNKEFRKIGYHGCSNPGDMNVTVMATSGVDSDFGATSLRGYEVGAGGTFSPALDASSSLSVIQGTGVRQARVGSDVIQIKYADRTGAKLTGNTDPVNANIQVDSNPTGLSQNDIAIVSDCNSAHIFQITNVSTTGGSSIVTMAHASSNNSPHKMLPGYTTDADLLSYYDATYFVADTGRNVRGSIDVYSLYRKMSNSATPEELVEGVEFFQVLYGEDVGSGRIRFVPAGTSGLNMQSVVAIKFALLIQDFEVGQKDNDTRSYTLLDTTIPASGTLSHSGGKYLRKTFTSTVQLRNIRTSN